MPISKLEPKANFGIAFTTSPLADTGTSWTLNAGEGGKLPAIGTSQGHSAVIWDWTASPFNPFVVPHEVVLVTARAGDNISNMVRAQQGTSAINLNTPGHTYAIMDTNTAKMWADVMELMQSQAVAYGVATTPAADQVELALDPPAVELRDGMQVAMRMPFTNTATQPTLDLNGLGAKDMLAGNGGKLHVGQLLVNGVYTWRFSTVLDAWTLQTNTMDQALLQDGQLHVATSGGVGNDYELTLAVPRVGGGELLPAGAQVRFIADKTNTGAVTVTYEGNTDNLVKHGGLALEAGDIQLGDVVVISRMVASGDWQLTSAGVGVDDGENNTSSNQGAGVGLALPKSGVDLPFRTLQSTDGFLAPVVSGGGDEINLDLAAGALDVLLPTTTKGDLVVHDGANNVRLPRGNDYEYLRSRGASAEGVEWFPLVDDGAASTTQVWSSAKVQNQLTFYLPLTAGAGVPLTGDLYFNKAAALITNNAAQTLEVRSTTDMTVEANDGDLLLRAIGGTSENVTLQAGQGAQSGHTLEVVWKGAGGLEGSLAIDSTKLALAHGALTAGSTFEMNTSEFIMQYSNPVSGQKVHLTSNSALLEALGVGGNSSIEATGGQLETRGKLIPTVGNTDAIGDDLARYTTIHLNNDVRVAGNSIIPSTTAGDLQYYDGTKFVRLGIGTAGQVLTVNAGATAPEWAAGGGGGGEVNTASNVNTGGVGVFKQKTGVDLEFRGVNAASSKISVTLDGANNEIDLDVVEANLTLDNLGGTLSISKGGTGQTTKTAAFDALAPTTTKGDLVVHNGTNNVRQAVGTNRQVLEADSAQASGVKWAGRVKQFEVSLPGQASSTVGQLSKANSSTGNPGGLKPTTSSGDPGINNGGPDPLKMTRAGTINFASLTVAHAAVGTGTFTSPAVARFDVYRVDYSTRTKLGEINFNVTDADVFNNLGSNRFGTYTATPSISVAAGDRIGVEFVNVSGSNSAINALGGIYLAFEVQE